MKLYAMSRRAFLGQSLAATALLSGCSSLKNAPTEPIFKISLAQWSLNRHFFGRVEPKLDNLEFAQTARSFDIEAIEYVNQFFYEKAKDTAYLKEMKKRANDVGVKSLLIMVDREGALGNSDATKRTEVVEKHKKWVDAAKFLSCHSIRVNAQSDAKLSFDEQMKLAADGLRQLTEYGASQDINVIVENHGGLSSHGEWLVGVMELVDHPRCGTLPDFGNFAINRQENTWYDPYQGVTELMPYAKAVSAKAHAFDPSRPWVTIDERWEKETDFLKMMRIVLDAGYRGWVGIESEGGGDQYQGIRDTKALLERVRAKLTPEYT